MRRRDFLSGTMAAGTAALTPGVALTQDFKTRRKFKLNYAPHLGMFRNLAGEDPLDQIRFMADEGFTAFEDNGMRGRTPKLQEQIGDLLEKLGMQMGVFVGHDRGFGNSDIAAGKEEAIEKFVNDFRVSVEVAKRTRASWCTVIPGEVELRLEPGYQTANVVGALRRASEVCEPSGLVMVLEPLNWFRDHPKMFLWKIPQAFEVCRAVDSPSCKILFDIYHQQISEGNLIPNIERAWSEIAYFQIGDNPGRKEPGTGEINYRNVFRHIHGKGFRGVCGMEHGNSMGGAEGERAVIEAYARADDF